jgi:hypothetical protein
MQSEDRADEVAIQKDRICIEHRACLANPHVQASLSGPRSECKLDQTDAGERDEANQPLKWRNVQLALTSAAAFTLCSVANPAQAAPPPGPDPCVVQSADAVLWVPLQFDTSTVVASESGSYAYGERACTISS